jgi:hypothetical protein
MVVWKKSIKNVDDKNPKKDSLNIVIIVLSG